MAQSLIACPLCSAASFSSTSSLCLSLISVTSKWLRCTFCEEELRGLDKLTIHLLSHLIHTTEFKKMFTTEHIASADINSSSQPLNLIKNQNKQTFQESTSTQNSVSEMLNSLPVQTLCDSINERHSLKIDDEVMIFFNCNQTDKDLQNKNNNSPIRALDLDTPSLSGLPKFNIDFKKTISNQEEGTSNSDTENAKPLSLDNYFDGNSRNEIPHYFSSFENNKSPPNQNESECPNDCESQMELTTPAQEKTLNNCLIEMGNSSSTRVKDTLICGEVEKENSTKSSFLSPKGERVLGYRCDICSLVFPDEHILSMHRQLIHIEVSGNISQPVSYKCHLCSKSFVMRGSLMVHMRVAHFGGAVVARLVESKQLETDAVSPESAQFVCSICNKGFRKEQQLVQHEKIHDGKQCDICLKTFTTKYFLRKHKRLHTGEMPYQCSQCNKSFTFQQSYHKHLLYHSDDKPYTCSECGRAFKELSTLHNHQRIHTGEKPFSCETCGMLVVSVC